MKVISIEITSEDVEQLLAKHLVMPNKEKFVELLVGHLSKHNIALEQIYKALIGVYPKITYKQGDWVYVPIDSLTSWRMDKEKTKALPGVVGDKIPCEITKVDIYQDACYDIRFVYIPKGSEVATVENYSTQDKQITGKVENIADVLDEMEEIEIKTDLPF